MDPSSESESPRLHKALAAAGIASRRACEEMIASGRVKVNGRTVSRPGLKIDPGRDSVTLDGQAVALSEHHSPITLMLNKPAGVVSTASDTHGRATVLDLVSQVDARLYPVGRLDADSSGLLLLTNDGDLAFRLTHPRFHIAKRYRVRAQGYVERESAQKLAEGLVLTDGRTAPAEVAFVDYDSRSRTTTLDLTLYEGRNRQVRRMMEAVGHPVRRLERIGFGSLLLKDLAPGTWRKLRPTEIAALIEESEAGGQGRNSRPPAPRRP